MTCTESQITIKQKLAGKWYDVSDSTLGAGSLEQFVTEFGNVETIAKHDTPQGPRYFVSTQGLLEAYRKRGEKVQLITEAFKLFRR